MCILLITAPETIRSVKKNYNYAHFLPVSRLQTYIEIINGSGLKFAVKAVDQLLDCQLSDFQAIIVTCSFKHFKQQDLSALMTASQNQGVSIVTDSFLITKKVYSLFAITNCTGHTATGAIINEQGDSLYQPVSFPYSEQGKSWGIRSILRFLFQNWCAKKISCSSKAQVKAHFSSQVPAIISHDTGKASNVLLNFNPALVFKEGGDIHTCFREIMLTVSSLSVGFDLSKKVCLRMDDPGSSERVYLEDFNLGVISAVEWQNILGLLKQQQAHLNVAYVPQWIDDGDVLNGDLYYQGEAVDDRKPGQLYNSWQIRYHKKDFQKAHDYAAEFSVIKQGVDNGMITILSHGLTHLTTYAECWLKAKDRYTDMRWFREFREMKTGKQRSVEFLVQRMQSSRQLLQSAFARKPLVFVPSAHEQTLAIPAIAMQAGFKSCSSRGLFILENDIISNRKIKAFYPNELTAAQAYNRAGYPVIFCFHDYDIYQYGSHWLNKKIDLFKSWGVNQFISLELLTALLTAKVEFFELKQSIVVSIQFPFALSTESIIPLRVNRKISALLLANNSNYSVPVSIKDNVSVFSIPETFIDSENRLELKLTIVDDEFE